MRPPITRNSPTAAKPLGSAALLLGFALTTMLIALQQPWAVDLLGAASPLVVAATALAVAGAAVGMLRWAKKLRPGLSRLLWVTQLPLLAVIIWVWLSELIGGAGFGIGAALALGGALLATQNLGSQPPATRVGEPIRNAPVTPTSLVSSVSLAVVGFLALGLAVAAPIVSAVTGAPWQVLVSTIVFTLLCLYLAWGLLVPILQLELPLANRIFPVGRWFPRTNGEQVTAQALVLVILGGLVSVFAVFRGSNSGWVAHLAGPGLVVWLVPALAACGFTVVAKNWRRCAPAVRRRAIERAALLTATAIGGYLVVAYGLQMIVGGVTVGAIIIVALAVVIPGIGWLDYQGLVSLATIARHVSDWANRVLLPELAETTWSVDDLPILANAPGELWSGAHKWVGPTFAQAVEDPAGEPSGEVTEAELGDAAAPIVTEVVPERRADTTTHLPIAPNNLDGRHPGESNPMFTESGRIIIPLARPKWTPQQAIDPATHPDLLTRIALEAPHLRPQVARNPAASPELLDWLAELDDPDVNAALKSLTARIE